MAGVVTEASGNIRAGLPLVEVQTPLWGKRWVALPFTDHCSALGDDSALEPLIVSIAADAIAHGIGRVDMRAAPPAGTALPSRQVAVRHTLELAADSGAVQAGVSSMHQRNVRKAVRAGVEITRGNSARDVEIFYQLHQMTRRRHGVPIQPRRFFRLLGERVIAPGHGFVLTAWVAGAPIASAVFLAWNGVLIYKYGASDERSWEHRPNNLLMWTAMKWGCDNGYRSFDFGRSDLEDAGLRAFKSGWGAAEEPLIHCGTALPAEHARPFVQRALATMIRRGHPWVSRALGELLYRYAA
jgi:CelD/BcsL family acetyltransferase involved in cellulose biosynthesis